MAVETKIRTKPQVGKKEDFVIGVECPEKRENEIAGT